MSHSTRGMGALDHIQRRTNARVFVAGIAASAAFTTVAFALICSTNVATNNPPLGYPLLPTPHSEGVVTATNSAVGYADAMGSRGGCDYSGVNSGHATTVAGAAMPRSVSGDAGCKAILTGTYTLAMGNLADASAFDCQDELGNYYDRGEAWGKVKLTDDSSQSVGPSDVHIVVLGQENPQAVPPVQHLAASYTTPPAVTGCVNWAQFWGVADAFGKAQVAGRAFAHGRGNYTWSSIAFTLQINYC